MLQAPDYTTAIVFFAAVHECNSVQQQDLWNVGL